MRQPSSRGPTARRRRAAGALCLSLAFACAAPAAEARPLRLVVNAGRADRAATDPRAVVDADPIAGLLRHVQLVLDAIFGGGAAVARAQPAPYAPPAEPVLARARRPAPEIVPYPGGLAAGTVVVDLDHLHFYRALGAGLVELRRARTRAELFAMIRSSRPS